MLARLKSTIFPILFTQTREYPGGGGGNPPHHPEET